MCRPSFAACSDMKCPQSVAAAAEGKRYSAESLRQALADGVTSL